MAIAICIAVAAPIFLIFVPQVIGNILHHTQGIWHVFIPGNAFLMYGISFLLLFLAAFLLFLFDMDKKSIITAIIFVPVSIVFIYVGSQSFQSLSENSISYQKLFSFNKHTYAWDEVDDIVYEKPEKGRATYEFTFQDGNKLTFQENGYLKSIEMRLIHKARAVGIEIDR